MRAPRGLAYPCTEARNRQLVRLGSPKPTIAAKAECARSTVGEALKALELARVLSWQHRIARIRGRTARCAGGLRAWIGAATGSPHDRFPSHR
jgi:hypothetical protein